MTTLEKFAQRLEEMIEDLTTQKKNLKVQNNISQFYYMQKVAELRILKENVDTATEDVKRHEIKLRFYEQQFKAEFADVLCQWRKDKRLLNNMAKQGIEAKL